MYNVAVLPNYDILMCWCDEATAKHHLARYRGSCLAARLRGTPQMREGVEINPSDFVLVQAGATIYGRRFRQIAREGYAQLSIDGAVPTNWGSAYRGDTRKTRD